MQLRCKYCKAVQMVSVADEADEDLRTQGIRRTFRAEHEICGEKAVSLEVDGDGIASLDPEMWNRYIAHVGPPADVIQGADGFFSRTIQRDGRSHNVRVCEGCWQNIPRYIEFPAGLISPESDGMGDTVPKLRLDTVATDNPKRSQAAAHLWKAVCLRCYLEAFARVWPGVPAPPLNPAVVGDGSPIELPKEPEAMSRADGPSGMDDLLKDWQRLEEIKFNLGKLAVKS